MYALNVARSKLLIALTYLIVLPTCGGTLSSNEWESVVQSRAHRCQMGDHAKPSYQQLPCADDQSFSVINISDSRTPEQIKQAKSNVQRDQTLGDAMIHERQQSARRSARLHDKALPLTVQHKSRAESTVARRHASSRDSLVPAKRDFRAIVPGSKKVRRKKGSPSATSQTL